MQQDKLSTLPNDVLLMIIGNLDYKDVNSLSEVNKRLYDLTNDNLYWRMKLDADLNEWKIINSSNLPIEIYENRKPNIDSLQTVNYKQVYSKCCPDVHTQIEILKKLKTYKNSKSSEIVDDTKQAGILQAPKQIYNQLRNYVVNSFIYNELNTRFFADEEIVKKIVMFGPGLETTTCCLVTNLLWKSDFETIGMIPGMNGYGSGLKVKLFTHQPFNLTILYTNVINVRQNKQHNLEQNKLLTKKANENGEEIAMYELNGQVKDACTNASGFVYVIDNALLSDCVFNQSTLESTKLIQNYKQELITLMQESNSAKPLLILVCTQDGAKQSLTCSKIIELFKLYELKHEWQMRQCNVFQNKMKDIILGFDWLLNKVNMPTTDVVESNEQN